MKQAPSLVSSVGLVIFLSGLLWSAPAAESFLEKNYQALAPPPLAGIKPLYLDIVTLGHKNLYDDISLLWLLQGLLGAPPTVTVDAVLAFIKALLKSEPAIESMYLLSCYVLFKDYKRPDLCLDIIKTGMKVFPNSWRLPLTQAYIFAVPLKSPVEAAPYYRYASTKANAPEFLATLADKLAREHRLSPEDLEKSLKLIMDFVQTPAIRK